MTSLPAREPKARHAARDTLSLTNRTEPSPARTFTPPAWAAGGRGICMYQGRLASLPDHGAIIWPPSMIAQEREFGVVMWLYAVFDISPEAHAPPV